MLSQPWWEILSRRSRKNATPSGWSLKPGVAERDLYLLGKNSIISFAKLLKIFRTKLLRVWHSWGEERKNVRFSLRRAEKTWTFSRSSSKRRKLRKVDGPEVFIDGPCGEIKEDQRSISDDSISESGSTSSAHSFTSDSTISEVEENNKGTFKFFLDTFQMISSLLLKVLFNPGTSRVKRQSNWKKSQLTKVLYIFYEKSSKICGTC